MTVRRSTHAPFFASVQAHNRQCASPGACCRNHEVIDDWDAALVLPGRHGVRGGVCLDADYGSG